MECVTPAPVWVVLIDVNKQEILATCWDKSICVVGFDGQLRHKISTPGTPFGITSFGEGKFLVIVERGGVFELRDYVLTDLYLNKSAAYNVSVSSNDSQICFGSYGPLVSILDEGGNVVGDFPAEDVRALYCDYGLLIVGDGKGEISFRTLSHYESPFLSFKLASGSPIWNLAYDSDNQKLFVASGDGSLHCYHCDIEKSTIQEIREFQALVSNVDPPPSTLDILNSHAPETIKAPALIDAIQDGKVPVSEAKQILRPETELPSEIYSPLLNGLLAFAAEEFRTAARGLQTVSESDPNHRRIAPLLIYSLAKAGDLETARQYVLANLEFLHPKIIERVLGVDLQTSRPVLAQQSIRDFSRDSQGAATTYLPTIIEKGILDINPTAEKQTDTSYSKIYNVVNYLKYQYSNRADHAKKVLELNQINQLLSSMRRVPIRRKSRRPYALDIGCATGRYPLFFAEMGFNAVGYDVTDEAVWFSTQLTSGNPHIHIEKKNILQCAPETDKYALVSCMMGTFNHIETESQKVFVKWIFDSICPGGLFVFSSWNMECMYSSQLYFYTREVKEGIRKNVLSVDEYEHLLRSSGFNLRGVYPACFLPDECYEAWLGEITEQEVVKIDEFLGKFLGSRNAQMFLLAAAKP